MEQVRLALEERKKSNPPPVSKPGRQAPNFRFDEATFAKWRAGKIVELARLLAWRANLPASERSKDRDWVLGEWLGYAGRARSGNLSKKTAEAKRTLREALACRPALIAQITQDAELAVPEDAILGVLLRGLQRNEDGELEIVLPGHLVIAKRIDTGS